MTGCALKVALRCMVFIAFGGGGVVLLQQDSPPVAHYGAAQWLFLFGGIASIMVAAAYSTALVYHSPAPRH